MKKLILSIAVLFGLNAYSQATTWEEYNYISNGIPQQVNNGLDVVKKGYVFDKENTTEYNINGVNFIKFTPLLREAKKNKNESIAGIFVEYQHGINDRDYFCLPVSCTDTRIKHDFYSALGLYCNDCSLSDYSYKLDFISNVLYYSNIYLTTIISEVLNPTE